MKQKVVIRLSLSGNDQKCQTKAFKVAISQPGVESAAMTGDEKSQLEVVGEQIDSVKLTSVLRKTLGQAELVSVGPAGGDKKKDEKAGSDKKPEVAAIVTQPQPALYYYTYPQYPVYQVTDSYDQSNCSIM
ncbi:heavy metal-associated isoprenylated plant protein 16-like isoform X1 [Lycium barbarum]|uniref:heavy metal-associated isoprenylated plant protein 16-like isoform X1 n=1 Tax=Lycium barbarum TaxID=112863 RepID=UPI00293E2664|nr:heavy metal-associated isoprenylated plant protein 16-like isoform X1 [Lycium barbarum]